MRLYRLSSAKPSCCASVCRFRSNFSAAGSFPQYLVQPHPPHRRRVSTRPPVSSLNQPRKAASLGSITFTLLTFGTASWLYQSYFYPGKSSRDLSSTTPDSPQHYSSSLSIDLVDPLTMTTNEAPTGTVNNLTADQEAKLRELWILVAKVCGIKAEGLEKIDSNSSAAAPASPQVKEKPKKRFGWFGRSQDDDAASTQSTENAPTNGLAALAIADGDDKFGQGKEFQQALVDMSPEEIRTTLWTMVKHDSPDALLLRFLRARKWDVKKALVMLISTIRWRLLEVKVDDDIMKNGEALAHQQLKSSDPAQKKQGEEFLMQMRMGKTIIHGVDKFDRPISIVRVRLHRPFDQSSKTIERLTVFTIESARLMLKPPVETAVSTIDIDGQHVS